MGSEHPVPVCRPYPQQLAPPPFQLAAAFRRSAPGRPPGLGDYPHLQTLGTGQAAPAAVPEASAPPVPARLLRWAVAGIKPVVVVGHSVRSCPMLPDLYAHDVEQGFRHNKRCRLGILHCDMRLVLNRGELAVPDSHSSSTLFHQPEGTNLGVRGQRATQRNPSAIPLSSYPDGHPVWRHAEPLVIVHFQRLRPFLAGTKGQSPEMGAGQTGVSAFITSQSPPLAESCAAGLPPKCAACSQCAGSRSGGRSGRRRISLEPGTPA